MADVAIASSVSNPLNLDDEIGLYRDYAVKGDAPTALPTINQNSQNILDGTIAENQFTKPQDFAQICILLGTASLLRGDELKNQDKDKAKNYYETAAKLFEKANNQRLQNLAKNKIILLQEDFSSVSLADRWGISLQKFFSTLARNFIVALVVSMIILLGIWTLSLPFVGPTTIVNLIAAASTMLTSGVFLTQLAAIGIFAVLALAAIVFLVYTFNGVLDTAARAYNHGRKYTNAEDAVAIDDSYAHAASKQIIRSRNESLEQEKTEAEHKKIEAREKEYHEQVDKIAEGKDAHQVSSNNNAPITEKQIIARDLIIHYMVRVANKPISESNPDPIYARNKIRNKIEEISDIDQVRNLRRYAENDVTILGIINARIRAIERAPIASRDASEDIFTPNMGKGGSAIQLLSGGNYGDENKGRRLTRKSPEASSSILSASADVSAHSEAKASSIPTPTESASLSAGSSVSLSASINIITDYYPDAKTVVPPAASTSVVLTHSASLTADSTSSLAASTSEADHNEEEDEKEQEQGQGMELADFSANTLGR